MRAIAAAAFALLGACVVQRGDGSYPPDPGWSDPPPPTTYGCDVDTDCSNGDLCARTHECLPSSEIRAVHVLWTVAGAAADANTCAASPDLGVEFIDDTGYHFGYAPVPCMEGRFNVDKLPLSFDTVELGIHDGDNWTDTIVDPTTGNASFDLQP